MSSQNFRTYEDLVHRPQSRYRWIPKAETEAFPTAEDLYFGATAGRSSHNDGRAKMDFAHAQIQLEEERRKKPQGGLFKPPTSIPLPYCGYQHIQNHGQLPAVSNFSNNAGNLPGDFPKLKIDGNNLLEWSQQIQVIFLKENLLFFINNPPGKPWDFDIDCIHHRAFFLLISSISPAIYHSIGQFLTVSEIMQKMFSLFYSGSIATTTKLSKDFFSSRIRPGISMSEHLLSLNASRAELHLRGEIISDQTMKSVILNSLDQSWDNYITNLDTLNLGYLTIDKLSNKLIAEDNLRRCRHNPVREHRLNKKVAFQDRLPDTPECYNCRSRNHYRRDCPKNPRDRGRTDHRLR